MKKKLKTWDELTLEEKVQVLKINEEREKISFNPLAIFGMFFLLAIILAMLYAILFIAMYTVDIYNQLNLS